MALGSLCLWQAMGLWSMLAAHRFTSWAIVAVCVEVATVRYRTQSRPTPPTAGRWWRRAHLNPHMCQPLAHGNAIHVFGSSVRVREYSSAVLDLFPAAFTCA